jgi:hypothetical protein
VARRAVRRLGQQAPALTLSFVARRLLAEPIGIVFGTREPGEELRHIPEVEIQGVRNGDARALLSAQGLTGRIEESFVRRLELLPDRGRRLLLVAAAEPAGDPALLWRAAEQLGLGPADAEAPWSTCCAPRSPSAWGCGVMLPRCC